MKNYLFLPFLIWALFCFLSCNRNDENLCLDDNRPCLKYLKFCSEDNPELLIEDVECEIVGDSVVQCFIPYILSNKMLIARFEAVGGGVF